MIEPDAPPVETPSTNGVAPHRGLKPGTEVVRWNRAEVKAVAQATALMFRDDPPSRFTQRHFLAAQKSVLPPARHKHQFNPGMIELLRREIAKVPLPPDDASDTARVHNGGYDSRVAAEPQPELPLPDKEPPRELPPIASLRGIFKQPSGDACEELVAILVEINQRALALKQFTAGQIENAVADRLDAGRLRSLTIQASNALTYFEELLRIAAR